MAFEYNAKAHYAPFGKHNELITGGDLTQQFITVQDNNKMSSGFKIKLPDMIFDLKVYKYLKHGDFYDGGGFQTAKSAYNFQHNPMKLWETQLNFAVHCATSGIGVSTEHLNMKEPMVRSLYRFHVYYHIRRILKRIQAPLPSEDGFDKYNNTFSLDEVKRIGDEYGVSTQNMHLYQNEFYFDRTGRPGNYFYEHNNWSRWIMNSSHGFTKHGIEKISESIRAYTYLILTSQAAARHGILGEAAQSLDAQRIFYDNLEDVINKSVSLEADIGRYQSVLKYARSSLDYSVGKGLYMLPSDMFLKPLNQIIEGYNDKIVVNNIGFELGKNYVVVKHNRVHVNRLAAQQGDQVIQHRVITHQPKKQQKHNHRDKKISPSDRGSGRAKPVSAQGAHTLEDHEEEKQALILALSGLTLFIFWCS